MTAPRAPLWAGQSTTPQVGIVQNPDDFDGYGCRFQLASDYEKRNDRHVFVSSLDEEAIMNIDGSDVRLSRIGFEAGADNNGNRFVDQYRRDELAVRIELEVTRRCSPSDENCEVTLYDAVIVVTRGTSTHTVTTKGFCGG
jgi:hypothetical protein